MTFLEALRVVMPVVAAGASDEITTELQRASEAHGVPVAVLAAVCIAESGMGRGHYLCGMPPRWETDHAQADGAAHALARWHRVCHTWEHAAQFYHTGRCDLLPCRHHVHGQEPYGTTVLRDARRIHEAMGVPESL